MPDLIGETPLTPHYSTRPRVKTARQNRQAALRAQRLESFARDYSDRNVFLTASSRDPRYKVEEHRVRAEALLADLVPHLPQGMGTEDRESLCEDTKEVY